MDILLARIKELLFETMSTQEQMILLYLETNINDLKNQNLATVADNNYCSTTSVTRLVKKLGYTCYRELQQSLDYTPKDLIDESIINCPQFIEEIKNTKCLYIYGKGASQISGLFIFRKLLKLGYDASLIEEQDLLYSLNNKTVLFISNSGETSTVCKVMADIKEFNRCKLLAITAKDSSIDKLADCSITHDHSIYTDRDDQQELLKLITNICAFL